MAKAIPASTTVIPVLKKLTESERRDLIIKLLQEQVLEQRVKLHFWRDLTKQAAQIDTG